jgi:hypothetical protein
VAGVVAYLQLQVAQAVTGVQAQEEEVFLYEGLVLAEMLEAAVLLVGEAG